MRIYDSYKLSLEAFASKAKAIRNHDIPRKWTVYFGEVEWKDGFGNIHRKPDHAFSDADTRKEAIRDVHRGAVNNALYANTPEGREIMLRAGLPLAWFPPPHVLALYPDLVEKFPDAIQGQLFLIE